VAVVARKEHEMPEALVIEFAGVDASKYLEVNSILGIDPKTGEGDWPEGLVSHTGGTSQGGLVVFEIWETREAQDSFMSSRLGPALGQAEVPEPSRLEWLTVEGHHIR
jgi:hypothetical protein